MPPDPLHLSRLVTPISPGGTPTGLSSNRILFLALLIVGFNFLPPLRFFQPVFGASVENLVKVLDRPAFFEWSSPQGEECFHSWGLTTRSLLLCGRTFGCTTGWRRRMLLGGSRRRVLLDVEIGCLGRVRTTAAHKGVQPLVIRTQWRIPLWQQRNFLTLLLDQIQQD